MRARQPIAQLASGFVGCASVEGHERGGHARTFHDAGAPALGIDGGHLDEVGPSPDEFFETMYDVQQCLVRKESCWGPRRILRFAAARSSEAGNEGVSTIEGETFS